MCTSESLKQNYRQVSASWLRGHQLEGLDEVAVVVVLVERCVDRPRGLRRTHHVLTCDPQWHCVPVGEVGSSNPSSEQALPQVATHSHGNSAARSTLLLQMLHRNLGQPATTRSRAHLYSDTPTAVRRRHQQAHLSHLI